MEDKEVGELWQATLGSHWLNHIEIRRLIRKLVEERANIYYGHGLVWGEAIKRALRDYHIDPATWPSLTT